MEDRTYVELREPGCVPELKGPFNAPGTLKAFLIEAMDARPAAFITVVRISDHIVYFEDGPECLELIDGRQRHRAHRHRENTAAAFHFAD